ncbi:MAG: hypothetical protein WCP31_08290, partial [Chloroflexales bacterium]
MTGLAGLKLTAARKPQNIPPVLLRRNKMCKRIAEQIELARALQAGGTFSPKRLKTVKDADGNKKAAYSTPFRSPIPQHSDHA